MEHLIPNNAYHIYNRAIGNEKLFKSKDNYHFFLKRYEDLIFPIAETYCYCLIPNHFHFLIKIRSFEDLFRLNSSDFVKYDILSNDHSVSNYLSLQFGRFFNSYTQAYNRMYYRKGGLMIKPFKRKMVKDTKYLHGLVTYIHLNPIQHGLVTNPEDWEYSSYRELVLNHKVKTFLSEEVIEWFGGKENFTFCHH